MNQVQYYIEIDDWAAEELTVENLLKYRGQKIKFIKNRKSIEKSTVIQELAETILKESREWKERELKGRGVSRMDNGRFDCNNKISKKLIVDDDKIYLLYLLCGSMEKTGDALGVTRQTVAEPIRQYEQWLKEF